MGILNYRAQSVICHTVGLRKGGSLHPDKDRLLPHLIRLAPLPKRQDTGTAILGFGEQVNLYPTVWGNSPAPLAESFCRVVLKAESLVPACCWQVAGQYFSCSCGR